MPSLSLPSSLYNPIFLYQKVVRLLMVGGVAMLLHGCETLPVATGGDTRLSKFDASNAELKYQEYTKLQQNWEIDGKFSFSSPQESGQGRYKWRRIHGGKADVLDKMRLFGPFGAKAVTIEVDQNHVKITSGQNSRMAQSVNELSMQMLGWMLPFEAMHYWVFGLPVEHSSARVAYDDAGQIRLMQQDGWEIQFSGSSELVNQVLQTPKRIKALHSASGTTVQLIVSKIRL